MASHRHAMDTASVRSAWVACFCSYYVYSHCECSICCVSPTECLVSIVYYPSTQIVQKRCMSMKTKTSCCPASLGHSLRSRQVCRFSNLAEGVKHQGTSSQQGLSNRNRVPNTCYSNTLRHAVLSQGILLTVDRLHCKRHCQSIDTNSTPHSTAAAATIDVSLRSVWPSVALKGSGLAAPCHVWSAQISSLSYNDASGSSGTQLCAVIASRRWLWSLPRFIPVPLKVLIPAKSTAC